MSTGGDFRIEKSPRIVSISNMELNKPHWPLPIHLIGQQWQALVELCEFTSESHPLFTNQELLKKLKTLSSPIIYRIKDSQNEEFVFNQLCDYFFDVLCFRIDNSTDKRLDDSLLPYVLSSRKGPAPLLMLLLNALLEEGRIRTQVKSLRGRLLIKVQLNNQVKIADFANKCRFLETSEILGLINQGFDFSEKSPRSTVIEYLNEIKSLAKREQQLDILSLAHSYLMKYQPFNLHHVSERAKVAFESGKYQDALEDIRNYFLYKQPHLTNRHLKKIYKLALRKQRNIGPQEIQK